MSKQLVRLTTLEKIASQRAQTEREREPSRQAALTMKKSSATVSKQRGWKKIMTERRQGPTAEFFYLQLIALKQNPQAV